MLPVGYWQGAASAGPGRAAAATGLPTPLAVARSGEGASGPGVTAFRVLLLLAPVHGLAPPDPPVVRAIKLEPAPCLPSGPFLALRMRPAATSRAQSAGRWHSLAG